MTAFLSGVRVILSLELRQRVRGVAWYVLLGVFFLLVGLVTALLTVALTGFGAAAGEEYGHTAGSAIFSTIIYFVLLLGTLVAPALSGNAINGDRDAGTLATTQVTLVTTWQLVIGKFLAAWITALAFLVAALPFLLFTFFLGGLDAGAIIAAFVMLAVELGVVAAIGVGLSGILNRPLFSVVVTYLAVAALSIGTLIAFTLGGLVTQTSVQYRSSYSTSADDSTGATLACSPVTIETARVPNFSYYWGILAANPYVVLADAVPGGFDSQGNPRDLFGTIKVGVRSAQLPPSSAFAYSTCIVGDDDVTGPSGEQLVNSTVPGWFVGLILHIVLAAGALTWAWGRTRTPARRLGPGRRIA
jgi:ABC-2 type transport system permease protein